MKEKYNFRKTIKNLDNKTLSDQLEEAFDLAIADEAYRNYVASGCKSTPIEDFWKELDAN